MTQNLSSLTGEADEENDRSTEQKYQYDDALSTSEEKQREMEAVLAKMLSEHEIECQRWDAERSVECTQWESDNCLWDEMCERLKAQHQQGM